MTSEISYSIDESIKYGNNIRHLNLGCKTLYYSEIIILEIHLYMHYSEMQKIYQT